MKKNLFALATVTTATLFSASDKPNVIFILADDWGIGDVKCLGKDNCKFETPHMDKLAADGVVFTNAHSSSSVCTPTRYSCITGRYNWRSSLKRGVLWGLSSHLIQNERKTVGQMMQDKGYKTACIGKWHLGLDLPTLDGKEPYTKIKGLKAGDALPENATNINWQGTIGNGPVDRGFNYFYGIPASLDMPPYIWVENNKFVGECSIINAFASPYRLGPATKDFSATDVLGTVAKKSSQFIRKNKDQPLFMYIALNSPHTPIVPSAAFKGKSKYGAYGDFVMETDWAIGEIVKAVDESGLGDNTLIIVTADNGCSPAATGGFKNKKKIKFTMQNGKPVEADAHYPSAELRGHKADIYEGGHRVPFIARWKGTSKPGSVTSKPVCLVDLYATCADLVNHKLLADEAVDSVSFVPLLKNPKSKGQRETTIHHSIQGRFAITKGDWKLVLCEGSGGWSQPRSGKTKTFQLFNLKNDLAEQKNVIAENPEVVKELKALLEKQVADGRSTRGPKQENTGKVKIY